MLHRGQYYLTPTRSNKITTRPRELKGTHPPLSEESLNKLVGIMAMSGGLPFNMWVCSIMRGLASKILPDDCAPLNLGHLDPAMINPIER
jgi:hypothetical protein